MMHTAHNSPAANIAAGAKSITDALAVLQRRGMAQGTSAGIAFAVHNLTRLLEHMPSMLATGRHQQCAQCEHQCNEVVYVGMDSTQRPTCKVADLMQCPVVREAGFISESDINLDIPAAFRRQAE